MTTPLHAQTNARNAQHSTGPVTGAGKARSARNAVKHGYYARDIVMPGEDGAQFERLLAGIETDWAPQSDAERELTDEIAAALWRRRRLRRAEAELWAERCAMDAEEPRTLGRAFVEDSASAGNAIEKLRRWWQGNERHLNRCQERLALIKRLTQRDRSAPPPEVVREQRRHAAREIDLLIDAPAPGEVDLFPPLDSPQATDLTSENGKVAEQTQSHQTEPQDAPATAPGSPLAAATDPAAIPPGLPRKERRQLQRKLAKAQRKQERQGRQAAA